MEDKYYSIEEVSTLLKVAYLTVYRWVRKGSLEADKAGKQYRIKKSVLDGFLQKDTHAGG